MFGDPRHFERLQALVFAQLNQVNPMFVDEVFEFGQEG